MNAKRVTAAAGVILAAQKTKLTAAGIAASLEAACLLQSPESAAELVALRARVTELETLVSRLGARAEQRHLVDPLDHVLEHLADERPTKCGCGHTARTHRPGGCIADAIHSGLLGLCGCTAQVPQESAEAEALAAVDRSVAAQFPLLAALRAEDPHDSPLVGRALLDTKAAADAEATHWKRLGMTPPAPVEDPHDSPLHHTYTVCRDLPEVTA